MTEKKYTLARNFLGRVFTLKADMECKRRCIREVRDMAESITSHMSDMPHGSGASSKIENAVALIDELEREIAKEQAEMQKARSEIIEMLCRIPDSECNRIMLNRYAFCRNWDEIIRSEPEHRKTVFTYHRNGLRFVDQYLEKGINGGVYGK